MFVYGRGFYKRKYYRRRKIFFYKDVDIVSLNNASLLLKYEVVHDGMVIKDNDERSDFESLSLREYFDFKYYSDIYDNAMIERIKKESLWEDKTYG